MTIITIIIAFVLAALLIILGFVALLKQKTYLDAKTMHPIAVQIPIFGRIKTNYPAVIFVLFGFAIAWATIQKTIPPRKNAWEITGTLVHPEKKAVSWTQGNLALVPSLAKIRIFDNGRYEIDVDVDEDKTIDEVFEVLDYSHLLGGAKINIKDEMEKLRKNQPSLLASATAHTLTFRAMAIETYSQTEE